MLGDVKFVNVNIYVNVFVIVNMWLYMNSVYMCMQSVIFCKCQKFIKTVFFAIAEICYVRRPSVSCRT
jgi:hypothetical protein